MSTDSPSDGSKDDYMLDHSNPHPARMGEIYIDQLYHVMSGMVPIQSTYQSQIELTSNRNQMGRWR